MNYTYYPNNYPSTYLYNNYNTQNFGNQSQSTQTSGIIWVQGIEGAKAHQMIPNSITQLMDSENDGIFYIKVSDNVGMCSLRTFKYEEITNQSNQVDLSDYVKKSELEDLVNSMLGGKQSEQPVSGTKPTISK